MGNSKLKSKTLEDSVCFFKSYQGLKDESKHPQEQTGCCICNICLNKRCFYCLADDLRPRWRMRCEDTHERDKPCPEMCHGYKKSCSSAH